MFTKNEISTIKEIISEIEVSYDSIPIGGGNPYYMCPFCNVSDPEISIRGHDSYCKITQLLKRKETLESILKKLEFRSYLWPEFE